MTNAGDGGASTAVESTLGDEVGALMGDFSDSGSDGSSASDAPDAPSGERQAQPDRSATPEGNATAERAGDTPADAATAQPDSSAAGLTAEDDLLAGASPLTYVVNGEQRQFDGIQVLKDNAGAIVTPDALQLLTRRMGERDHLFEQNQSREKRYTDLEKLTEWRSQDKAGNPVVYSGAQGVEMRELSISLLKAEVAELRALFDRPPIELIGQDDQGNILWNRPAFDAWQQRLATVKENAYYKGKESFGRFSTQATAPAPAPTTLSEDQRVELAPQAADFVAQQLGITLTPDSKAILADVIASNPTFLRPATHADVQADPGLRLGMPVVDRATFPLAQRIAAQQKAIASTVQTNVDAAKTNAARLAAAALGKRPTQAQPTKPSPVVDDRANTSDQLWERMERAVSGRARSA